MTDETRLAEIEARLAAALERPWHAGSYNATSLFVAHAPADIRDLLAEVQRLRRRTHEIQEAESKRAGKLERENAEYARLFNAYREIPHDNPVPERLQGDPDGLDRWMIPSTVMRIGYARLLERVRTLEAALRPFAQEHLYKVEERDWVEARRALGME